MEDPGASPNLRWVLAALDTIQHTNIVDQGSVVRISPIEVHISDPEYATLHFSNATKRNKYAPHRYIFFVMMDAALITIDHAHHKLRRSPLSKVFSKKNVLALEPFIKSKIENCCSRLENFRISQEVIDLRLLFTCLTTDIVTEYAFARSKNLLSTADLSPEWRNFFSSSLRKSHWFKHFPFLGYVVSFFPEGWITHFTPNVELEEQIEEILAADKEDYNELPRLTMYHEILQSDLPPIEKSRSRLRQEGQSILGAGLETT